MAVTKVKIKYLGTGAEGKAALKDFSSMLDGIPDRIKKNLSSAFAPNVTNRIRGYFKDNYIQQFMWKRPSLKAGYAELKNKMLNRGDSFTIASLGTAPVIHGSEVFGMRTGTIFKAIGGSTGSIAKARFNKKGRNFDLTLAVGLNETPFEGSYYHNYTNKRGVKKRVKLTTRNQLEAFSHRISRSAKKSALVTISDSQAKDLAKYISNNFRTATKKAWNRK